MHDAFALTTGKTGNQFVFLLVFAVLTVDVQTIFGQQLVPVAEGWSGTTVNTVVFRKNSIVSHNSLQYIAFYDSIGTVVLGKREHGNRNWEIKRTSLTGNVRDAHNSISIMVDGDGYLHIAWDHHNNALRYAKSISPGSLILSEKITMINKNEESVSYTEFFKLSNTKLLFFYRDGK